MPRVTVVVPLYNVEAYAEECLRSIASQTVRDLDVVVVDDGSTDASPEIAARFAEADSRFRVISQSNRGLGAARNAGTDAADSEYVMYVDSDDTLRPDSLELMLASLARSGSDFATGAVVRFDDEREWRAPFLAKTFMRSRRRTHVTRFRWLVSDRIAWNKLWRRDFIARHDLRFTEGAFHEDIPMTIPAHFLARSVDVVATPIYRWRVRAGEARSITQRRLEPRMLRDRLAAIDSVCDFLARLEEPRAERWYHESVVAEDLRYHLDVLGEADDEYRALFLDRANEFLDRAAPGVEDPLPPIQRLKWHLVRRRLLPELLEVLRFEAGEFRSNPKVLRAGRVYGDYPFLDDRRLGIPRRVYRLDTTRRRAQHVVTLLRPARVPRRELDRRGGPQPRVPATIPDGPC